MKQQHLLQRLSHSTNFLRLNTLFQEAKLSEKTEDCVVFDIHIYKCDDDIVVIRASNCYDIKEFLKGKIECPVLKKTCPFKAFFFNKNSVTRIEEFHNRKLVLPEVFKPSQGDWIIAIDDRIDEDVEQRLKELLDILHYFSTPKQVLKRKVKDLRLEIVEHQLSRKDYALFVDLRMLAEAMMMKHK